MGHLIEKLLVSVVMLLGLTSAKSSNTQELTKSSIELETCLTEKESLTSERESLRMLNEKLQGENSKLTAERTNHLAKTANESSDDKRPTDCADLLLSGVTTSGVYDVYPFSCGCGEPIRVYCDMETDGGGWTVFLNREDIQRSQLNFNRTWEHYKNGFGSLTGEFWLGNALINQLTASRSYALRMDLKTPTGSNYHVLYDSIIVENEDRRYRLQLGSYDSESTISNDCYTYNKGQYFSTYDYGSSSTYRRCAKNGGGGFWFGYSCYIKYPPTGVYGTNYMNTTCYYNTNYQATNLQMKIRPSACESTYKKISFPGGFNCRSNCGAPARRVLV